MSGRMNRNAVATLRQPEELIAHGLAPAAALAELSRVAARYAVAVTPEVAALIDPDDPNDPIARQYIPSANELAAQSGERADPIGDHAHSPVDGIVHRYPDRVLLKLIHVCAVYCRFLLSPRNGRAGQGNRAVARSLRRGARLHRVTSGGLGSNPDRRRPADAVAAEAQRDHDRPRRDRARKDHSHSHPRAGGRSHARQR